MGVVTFSNLTSGTDATDGLTLTTASVSPTGNAAIFPCFHARNQAADATPSDPSVVGNGITYTLEDSILEGTRKKVFGFRGMAASPSSGTIVATFAANVRGEWSVDQATGVRTDGTNASGCVIQSVTAAGTNTSISITLASFHYPQASATFLQVGHDAGEATTQEGGWTELADPIRGVVSNLETSWLRGQDLSATASWATSAIYGGIAYEIEASWHPLSSSGVGP